MERLGNEASPHQGPLKIYFLPFPTPGHMIPMVNLARVFATRGENVTILTTPSNAHLLLPKQFNIHILDFPSDQVGLPPGLENLSSAKDAKTALKICIAANLLIPQIETFLRQNPPHAFVQDIMFTGDFSHLRIPTIPFSPMPLFASCIFEAISNHPDVLLPSNPVPFTIPAELPHSITLPVNLSHGFHTLARPFLHARQNGKKHGIIVNSFADLEPGYAEYYQNLTGVKVWHLGISSLLLDYYDQDHHEFKNDQDNDEHESLSWLNSREPNSVVYICFGSLCRFSREQYLEMARGIEASKQGFLWVVPKDDEEFCVPEGFDECKRGMVVKGWVPQVLILKHNAIGGFFTHCGWTSVGEGICAGVPMITMPRFSEQVLSERLVTEVHGLGAEVGEWQWSMSPYDAKNKVVSWERIEKAVRRVMEGLENGLKKCKRKFVKLFNVVDPLTMISLFLFNHSNRLLISGNAPHVVVTERKVLMVIIINYYGGFYSIKCDTLPNFLNNSLFFSTLVVSVYICPCIYYYFFFDEIDVLVLATFLIIKAKNFYSAH